MCVYYFAYGSNLSESEMQRTDLGPVCDDYEIIGKATLSGYRLAFTRNSKSRKGGVADIVQDPSGVVEGLVYHIGSRCLDFLDVKEGLGSAYNQLQVTVTLPQGKTLNCLTYSVITKSTQHIPPHTSYLNLIIQGAKDHGLSERYLDFLRKF